MDQAPLEEGERVEEREQRPSSTPQATRWDAELIIPFPVEASHLSAFYGKLHQQLGSQLRMIETVGSVDRGTCIKLVLTHEVSLQETLLNMPEVAQVWDEKGSGASDAPGGPGVVSFLWERSSSARRFLVTLKPYEAAKQLVLFDSLPAPAGEEAEAVSAEPLLLCSHCSHPVERSSLSPA
ncbi:MAG: hypothetical protein ACE5IG_02670 [Dehalococcoidia bacterium]